MTEPILKDPCELYHTGKFVDQDQDTPTLQDKILQKPDCGEGNYVGNHLLENRRVLIIGGDSGIGRRLRSFVLEKVPIWRSNFSLAKNAMQKRSLNI